MTRQGGKRKLGRWLLTGVMIALAGCGSKTPVGQVVAKVGDEEVTRRDLLTEIEGSGVQDSADARAMQPAILDRLVTRKLMVEEARRNGIDKTPEFLAADQRARELLLSTLLAKRWAAKVEPPSEADVLGFVSSNPHMFDGRKILLVDQIRAPTSAVKLADLKPLSTNDQIEALLKSRKQPFQRGRTTIDTLSLRPEGAAQIFAAPAGEPFVSLDGGMLVSNSVIGSRDAPVPEAARAQVARQAMLSRARAEAVENQVRSLRTMAKISYQPEFAPDPKAAR